MRRLVLALCLLLNISFALVPFSALHAHVDSDHHATQVHGGHDHDLGTGNSDHDPHHVVDLGFAFSDHGSGAMTWTHWLPLACSVVLLVTRSGLASVLLRPPASENPPPSPRDYWHPPLRGPPLSFIQAR